MKAASNVKRPKIDASRLEAEAYFNSITRDNNTVGNINSSAEEIFWTFNRIKIACSIILIVFMAYLVDFIFPPSPAPVYILLGYAYILTPVIGALAKRPTAKKFKKTLFIKMSSRVYKSHEVPAFLPILSFFSIMPVIGILSLFNFKGSDIGVVGFLLIPLTPFITYNILCFIGNHPLSIWKAYRYIYKAGKCQGISLFDDQGYMHGTSTGINTTYGDNSYSDQLASNPGNPGNPWVYKGYD